MQTPAPADDVVVQALLEMSAPPASKRRKLHGDTMERTEDEQNLLIHQPKSNQLPSPDGPPPSAPNAVVHPVVVSPPQSPRRMQKSPSTQTRASPRKRTPSEKSRLLQDGQLIGDNSKKLDLAKLKAACTKFAENDEMLRAWLQQGGFPERLTKSYIRPQTSDQLLRFLNESGIAKKLQVAAHKELDAKRSVVGAGALFELLRNSKLELSKQIRAFKNDCPIFSWMLDIVASEKTAARSHTSGPEPASASDSFVLVNILQHMLSSTHSELQLFVGLYGICSGWSREMFTLLNHLHVSVSIHSALRYIRANMDLFTVSNIWTQTDSTLEYRYSGKFHQLDQRGRELAAPFLHSWLSEGREVLDLQLVSAKEAAVDFSQSD